MAHDSSSNSPTKETLYSLVGVVLFAGLILVIGISAWMRPAMDDKYKTPVQPLDKPAVQNTSQ